MSAAPGLTDSLEYQWLWSKAHPRRGGAPAEGIITAAALRRAANELLIREIDDCRRAGWSWARIAQYVRMTPQAVSQLHKRAARAR